MAKVVTNECVCCGLPCMGDSCEFSHVVRWYCDECRVEFPPDELYVYEDDTTLCHDCLLEQFHTVDQMGEDYE